MITKFKIFENFRPDIYHGRYLNLEKLENGNLKITINYDGKIEVETYGIDWDRFSDYFEDIRCNSDYNYFSDLGDAGLGMTNSPGITDGYNYDDEGEFTDENNEENSDIYFYPNYMIKDFTEELIKNGSVIFNSSAKKTTEEIEEIKLKRMTNKYNV